MVSIGKGIEVRDELIKKACNLAMEAHNLSSGKPYTYKKKSGSMDAALGFAGTWSLDSWYSNTFFGETTNNASLFPSLRSVGTDEVEKAMLERKQIVFAGHLSGGPIAILAAPWCLECCLTSPNDNLVYPRENWACYFIYFFMKYDVVPRIMLAPLSSIQKLLQAIFAFINPKSQSASSVACNLKGCSTNLLLETVSNINLVVVENPDAVLQLLFYSSQMSSEAEAAVVVARSFNGHLLYRNEMRESLDMPQVLAGLMDEIIEMLKRYELPDSFEGRKDWIQLGTQFRRQVEPLDIANYYRHLKNKDTGPYMISARPKRYRFTQRWLEPAERVQTGALYESCFWTEVEELRNKPFSEVQNRVLSLETNIQGWFQTHLLGSDVFFPESTFTKWWKTLPTQHKQASWYRNK
ncbi:unnamed protein product [Withania somnifera]